MKKRSAGILAILLLFLAIIFGVDPFELLSSAAPEVILIEQPPDNSEVIIIDQSPDNSEVIIIDQSPDNSEVILIEQLPDNPTVVLDEPASWYQIFFTNPTCPPEAERAGGIDETVAATISAATFRVDVAAYDLDSPAIVNALIDLEKRDIPVRVVTDTDNATLSSINRLRRNGISVVEDKRSGLMHNKFIVIDDRYVWMGSMNMAGNDVYCHNNNFVQFDLPQLAANYVAEMDEMYIDRRFGPTSPDNTPDEQIIVTGSDTASSVLLENYFAPEKRVAPIIAQAINQAENEILFLAFSFTNDEIGEAMLAQAEAGVTVTGVFETVGANTDYSYYPPMRNAGLPNLDVRLDGNSYMMHHKVIILDRQKVIFGSFNFSDSANRQNDENIIIVHDAVFAGYFVEEFAAVWAEAKIP